MTNSVTESEQLEKGWKTIQIIWLAMLASLGVYLGLCEYLKKDWPLDIDPSLPIDTIRYALAALSGVTLVGTHYLRKYVTRSKKTLPSISGHPKDTRQWQHPAVARYAVAVLISLALAESVGIYGFVLFLLSKESLTLYQFMGASAIAMIYFRPNKEELMAIAKQYN